MLAVGLPCASWVWNTSLGRGQGGGPGGKGGAEGWTLLPVFLSAPPVSDFGVPSLHLASPPGAPPAAAGSGSRTVEGRQLVGFLSCIGPGSLPPRTANGDSRSLPTEIMMSAARDTRYPGLTFVTPELGAELRTRVGATAWDLDGQTALFTIFYSYPLWHFQPFPR
ncbi:hypothetical protein JZ751_027367 [Albula glossodonta]|uniref:Uncharacterized protein n=1 Tax=Albula glossodonta TaxID=121402 RepID=A0A8T2MX77_9TELE|nr:hypothetical protein JZ751_027367 [Albula glossodonta]